MGECGCLKDGVFHNITCEGKLILAGTDMDEMHSDVHIGGDLSMNGNIETMGDLITTNNDGMETFRVRATTGSLSLGAPNNAGSLELHADDYANSVILKAPVTITDNYILTLPNRKSVV